MKKSNSNGFIKLQLRKAGVTPIRITNEAGMRVWSVNGIEFPSLHAVAAEYLKKESK